MMEKLSAKEFDLNYEAVLKRVDAALLKSGREKDEVILLAATKTVDVDTINYAIEKGIDYIGENKVQELLEKYDEVHGIKWRIIGRLQTNKVKYIIDKVSMIESLDRVSLADEIDKQAKKHNKKMKVLVEVNAGEEDFFVDEENDWTVYTEDGSLSAQWEYTVAVTEDGVEIITH